MYAPAGPRRRRLNPPATRPNGRRRQRDDRPVPLRPIRRTDVTEYTASEAVSLRLDAGKLYHLAPFFGFVGDQLAELSRHPRQRRAADIGEARPHLGVGESRVDLPVERVDDLGRRVPGRTDP